MLKNIFITESSMGININSQNESDSEYVKAVYRFIHK